MIDIDIDGLTNIQLDRLWERLTFRAEQRKGEKEAARRAAEDMSSLRPQIGNGSIVFGNERARRNWDLECIAARRRQLVPYAVAPNCSVLARDGKTRLTAGQEIRPTEHLNAMLGDPLQQIAKLVAGGFVLAREASL